METPEFKEISIFDYLNIVFKRRRMIARNVLIAAFAMAIISFFLPKYYTATTTLLPPDDDNPNGLQGLLSNAPVALLDIAGASSSSSKIFVEILNSRTVAKGVLETQYKLDKEKKDLYEIWNIKAKSDAAHQLKKNTRISTSEQGVIRIDVEMRDPDLAAQVAKAYVVELDKVNQVKSLSKAKSSRIYIEEQLKDTEKDLKKASLLLANFQSKSKAVNLEEQTRVAIEKAGEIKGTIMAKEVELEVAKQVMKRHNPMIVRLEKELDELRKQFEHMQFGNSVPYQEQRDYFIPFANVPEVGLQFADLVREVKVQETVWQLLNQQFYSAKIQEARDTPTVQVLDEASPPEKRSSPKRGFLVLLASFLAFGATVFAAFVLEFSEKIHKDNGELQKARQMVGELKQDYHASRAWIEKLATRIRKPQ